MNKSNETPPTTSGQATSRWQSFNYKTEVSDYLNKEQYGLCAYSEVRPDEINLGTHLEHLHPKSLFPDQSFDYKNLLVSALSHDDLSHRLAEETFAGHATGDDYDEELFVSPLNEECARFFTYLSDGRVVVNSTMTDEDQRKANYTINLLNLNCEFLKSLRNQWLNELDQVIDKHLDDKENLSHIADCELGLTNHRLRAFHTAIRQRFGALGERIITEQYPELL